MTQLIVLIATMLGLALLVAWFAKAIANMLKSPPAPKPVAAPEPKGQVLREPVTAVAGQIHAAPCRLEHVMPPAPTGSWLGGRPRMPDHIAWPMGDGKPMTFHAQINLADVPRETWGGLHPETGWLLFFHGPEGGRYAAKVLHVEEGGAPRTPPPGGDGYYLDHRFERVAEVMFGARPEVLPEWPVQILATDAETRVAGSPYLSNHVPDVDPSRAA